MTIHHYYIMKTETVVITIHVTIRLQEVMLMGALYVKSFIQIIFRRNMLRVAAACYLFISRSRSYQVASISNSKVTLIDTSLTWAKYVQFGI